MVVPIDLSGGSSAGKKLTTMKPLTQSPLTHIDNRKNKTSDHTMTHLLVLEAANKKFKCRLHDFK